MQLRFSSLCAAFEGGAADARSAGMRLVERIKKGEGKVDHIVCSPAWRCQQTAHYIAVALGMKFKSIAGLHECYRKGVTHPKSTACWCTHA